MEYDLLIKGGLVVDPGQGLHEPRDVAIAAGRVAALAPDIPAGQAAVVDASGLVVTPGLCDLHTHVAEALIPLAAPPDEAGVLGGVTAVCDAGSTGYANLAGLAHYVAPQARTDLFCFLHLCPVGEALLPEVGWGQVSVVKMLAAMEAHPGLVRGVKVRATATFYDALGPEGVRLAREVAARAGLPLVVHLGLDRSESLPAGDLARFTGEILATLEAGDVLTHAFTARPGAVLGADGRAVPGLDEALERGVLLDVACSLGHLNFGVARGALARGLLPDSLSTDFTRAFLEGPVPMSLPVLMSAFLALGLSLDQVVERATSVPARILGEGQRRGSLRPGMLADVSLLALEAGDFLFVEGREGDVLRGDRLLVPHLTVKGGVAVEPSARARAYGPWCDEARLLLAADRKLTIKMSNPFLESVENVHEHGSQKTGFSK